MGWFFADLGEKCLAGNRNALQATGELYLLNCRLFEGRASELSFLRLPAMRPLLVLTAIIIASTGITPFDLTGVDIGADRTGEFTLTILVLISLFFALK